MFHLPEIPFNAFESLFFCLVAFLLAVALGRRILKSEFGKKTCVFCGAEVPAEEHAHHLEICGLKMMGRRQA